MDEEKEFLAWFYIECDFGPAHGDVIRIMCENYERETGNPVPDGYAPYDFESSIDD